MPRKNDLDNSTTFKAAADVLGIARTETVQEFLNRKEIKWKWTTSFAEWQGGIYKLLIQSIKIALQRTVGKEWIKEENFQTIVIENDAILNDRPLTYLGKNSLDVIQLNDFLLPQAELNLAGLEEVDDNDKEYRPGRLNKEEELIKT